MSKKVVFLDVDGTLTSESGNVSERVEKAIKQMRDQGHYVFLCTGRPCIGIRSLLHIGFDGYICSAGGYIEVHGQKIYESCLSDEDLKLARDTFEKNHVLYNLETNYKTFQSEEMDREFVKFQLKNGEMNSEMNRLINEQKEMFNIYSLEDYDQKPVPVQKLSFIAQKEEDLKEPRQLLEDKFHVVVHDIFSKDTINGEIIAKGTDKGQAVLKVMDYLNIPIEESICFGDSMNDYEMIKVCHHAVVMGNGTEELKKYATTVCKSVYDDGVYHELKRLGLCD